MKSILAFVFLFFFTIKINGQTVYSDKIFSENIKTVELYPIGNRLGEPVLFLNETGSLQLTFDELDSEYINYAYTLLHCDSKWRLSDIFQNEYLDGYTEAYIDDFRFSKNTKIPYIHYSLQIPNRNIQIWKSGNYILKIYPEGKSENPIITKKFYVVDQQCSIGGNIIAASKPEIRKQAQEVNFKVNISNLKSRFPSREITTQVQQNGRTDNQISKLEPLSNIDGILDFNLQKDNVFEGLNTFRFFDFSNLSYNSEYVYSINRTKNIDEIELMLSKFRINTPYKNEPTQFGKFYIDTKSYDDAEIEAEYALVNFFLVADEPIADADVYLVGGFDLWSKSQKLNYDYSSNLYHASVLLKQGYYSYQYASIKNGSGFADVASIEGSFFQTPNSYFIRVYYKAPGTTYDQLVGWEEIKNFIE